MKQRKNKAFFVVAAIATVGLGSYKAYGSYTAANMTEEDLLLTENALALSDNVPNGTVSVITSSITCYVWKDTGGTYLKGNEVYQKQTVDEEEVVNSCGLISIDEYDKCRDKLCWTSTPKYLSCEQANLYTVKPNPSTREIKIK